MTTVTITLTLYEEQIPSTKFDLGKLFDNHKRITNTGIKDSTDDMLVLNDDDDTLAVTIPRYMVFIK